MGLADRLRQARRRAALSQHELAALAGVGRQTVARAELGATGLRASTARKLADALGARLGGPVDPGWLLTGRISAYEEPISVLDAVGRPSPAVPPRALPTRADAPAAARAFALPSTRRAPPAGSASVDSGAVGGVWQRVVLAPGVELSFQPTDDPTRARAIADLIEEATRRLTAR